MKSSLFQNIVFGVISVSLITGVVFGLSYVSEKEEKVVSQVAETTIELEKEIKSKSDIPPPKEIVEPKDTEKEVEKKVEKKVENKKATDNKVVKKDPNDVISDYVLALSNYPDSVAEQKKAASVMFNDLKPYLTEKEIEYYKKHIDYQIFVLERIFEESKQAEKMSEILDPNTSEKKVIKNLKDGRKAAVNFVKEAEEYKDVPEWFVVYHLQSIKVYKLTVLDFEDAIKMHETGDVSSKADISQEVVNTMKEKKKEAEIFNETISKVLQSMYEKAKVQYEK